MQPALPELRGIHLPAPAGWWPPAPGWWLLAAAVAIALGWCLRRTWQARRRRRRLAAAMAEYDAALVAAADPPAQLAAASVMLRRAACLANPNAATLGGNGWLAFLDGDDPAHPFSAGHGALLADGGFRRHLDADAAPALQLARSRFAALCAHAHAGDGHA